MFTIIIISSSTPHSASEKLDSDWIPYTRGQNHKRDVPCGLSPLEGVGQFVEEVHLTEDLLGGVAFVSIS